MNFFVGTSGYGYAKWKGRFYPAKLPKQEMLSFYASRFRSVEINSSFYKMPEAATLQEWASQVPAGFRFTFKAPQRITHYKRLRDVGELTTVFLQTVGVLKKRLGPLLFQLPPNFKKDVPRLQGFLALLKPSNRVAMEFRHASWFDDEVFALLRKHKTAALHRGGGRRPRRAVSRDRRLGLFAAAPGGLQRRGAQEVGAARLNTQVWKDCFVFFKHEDTGTGPVFASRLLKALGAQ